MKNVNIKLKKKIESQKNIKSLLMKSQNGITLVALVVSIIVMLVLAGVSLNATIGENGIISRAQESKLRKEEADVETEILSGVAALDTEYYEKVSADSGITINSIYSISGLSKYVKGKINGFSYNKDGKSTVYYTNEMGSYTVVIDKNGQTKTYSGIYLEKNQISSIQMDKNDKITLSTDIEDVVWAVVSGDATVNPTTGEVVKNGGGTIIIKGADTNGNEVTVIIKDNTENNVAENIDVTNAIETANINDNVVAYIIPGEDGNNKLVIKGNGNIEDVENLQNMTNASTVTEIVIEEGIKQLYRNTFSNFTETKVVTIPESLNFCTQYTFEGLKKIEKVNYNAVNLIPFYNNKYEIFESESNMEVNIGNKVEYIPSYIFKGCKISNIVIPNSVKIIGECAFSHNRNLKYVDFGNGVEVIQEGAFMYTDLQNIILPDSVKEIARIAFEEIKNLQTVKLGNSIKEIKEATFYYSGVEEMILPDNIEKIGQYAFYGCRIAKIVLNNKIKEIGENAFESSTLKEITIPESIEKIGQSAFSKCSNLKKVTYNAINCEYDGIADYTYPLFYMNGDDGNDVLQEIVIGNRVEKIPEGIFSFINNVNKIEIPQSVKNIEQRAFFKSKGIKTLILNNGLQEIGNYAFYGTGIEELIIPESIKFIGQYAFADVNNLIKVVYNATECEYAGFDYKYNSISPLFSTNYNIQSIVIGNNVKKIPDGIFSNCKGLNELIIGKNVEEICNLSFYEAGIKELTLPESLKYIGRWAFGGCNAIGTLYYNSIHCSTQKIYGEDGIAYYPFQANDNEDLAKCYNIENIIIGDKVEYLDSNIFRKCNITTITIPSSVKYIAYENGNNQSSLSDSTFHNCTFLKEIIVKQPENSIAGAPWSNVSGITVKWEP